MAHAAADMHSHSHGTWNVFKEMALSLNWGDTIQAAKGPDVPENNSAENYRQRAEEMKSQAQRAETVYLQALYASIADNWDKLAAQMQAADGAQRQQSDDDADDQPPPPPSDRSRNDAKRAPL
jgi:hypothetical protein